MEDMKIHYGHGIDEVVAITTLQDEMKLKLCMKLFRTHDTLEQLESAIKRKNLTEAYKL